MTERQTKTPLVSVIMPTYNHAQFIDEAIASVRAQTMGDLELIIIDNYSTDETEAIVRRHMQEYQRIRYIKFRNEGIIAKSRNQGLEGARGEYVAFLDSDDVWDRKKLEYQMSYFRNHHDVGLVFSNHIVWSTCGKTLRHNRRDLQRLPNPGLYFKCLCTENPIGNSTVIIRRDMVEQYGLLDEDVRLCGIEDYEYWFRLSPHVQFGFVPQPLVLYRVLDSSISRRRLRMANGALLAFEKVMMCNPEHEEMFSGAVRKGRSMLLSGIGYAELLDGRRGWRSQLLRSLRYDPFLGKAWGCLVVGTIGPRFARCVREWSNALWSRFFRKQSEFENFL